MSNLTDALISRGKSFINNSIDELTNNAKNIVIEKANELTEQGMNTLKDRALNLFTKSKQNNENKSQHEIEVNHEAISLPRQDEQIQKIRPVSLVEDNDNSKEYTRIVKSKIINSKISSSSKYFLKLERSRLNISDDLGEEIEEKLLNNSLV
jgi:hypothetical protein